MTRATTTIVLAAALLLAGCGEPKTAQLPPGATPPSGPVVRILPLGDSITDGRKVPGAYRIELWKLLRSAGVRVDFVGSKQSGPGSLPDRDHEGHSGYRIDQIDADVTRWVNATDPRIVLVHLGTNDVLQDYQTADAAARMSRLLDHIIVAAPDADVFVGSLLPLEGAAREAAGTAYSGQLSAVVAAKGPKVHFVDMHSALTLRDLDDGIHPTAGGFVKMADAWAKAVLPVLRGPSAAAT
ncbi:SGNH/GDSL hydrolase family protein [Dactylosporangium sp. CA-233914]|uniref:SGNH/GDSL hydrolase family protein n=1 Tax=Dactylosporangium sp. CA-233914 TaxID=3239934 RepID=UPI003D8A3D11